VTLKSITNPSEFRLQIMEPDYAAFAHEPTDLRLAFHAASSLFHLRDWVAHTCGQTKNQLQSDLEGLCKSFGLITDIANSKTFEAAGAQTPN
jgi:hypothetical protein